MDFKELIKDIETMQTYLSEQEELLNEVFQDLSRILDWNADILGKLRALKGLINDQKS